jgi:hypothetical protein
VTVADYRTFLEGKTHLADKGGFEPTYLPDHLFGFQRELVEWSVRHGRAAVFADCGLGKTPMELAWARNVTEHTGKPVLLLTPLAVGFQVVQEAEKFGADAALSRDGSVSAEITVTNYEQLEKFNPADYAGVVCDESSAIKAFDGQRRLLVTEFMRKTPYRLLGTATAAPNDFIELGTSSEALGHLGHMDMLNRFFRNDNNTSDVNASRGRHRELRSSSGGWRFKGHAVEPFWRWVSSWARAIRKPSDYGYADGQFILPDLVERVTVVDTPPVVDEDALFPTEAVGLADERRELRATIRQRCEAAAGMVDHDQPAVVWVHLNDESALASRLIPDAVEVSGSDSPEAKEEKLAAFTNGEARVLVTKPKIGAWGLNWQHCAHMTFFPSHSYEQYYQAVRRSYRFGQTRPVEVDVITTEGGRRALESLQRKSEQADRMFTELISHMREALAIERVDPFTTQMEVPEWLS